MYIRRCEYGKEAKVRKIRVNFLDENNKELQSKRVQKAIRSMGMPNFHRARMNTKIQEYQVVHIHGLENTSDEQEIISSRSGMKRVYYPKNSDVSQIIRTYVVRTAASPKGTGDGGTPPYIDLKRRGRK